MACFPLARKDIGSKLTLENCGLRKQEAEVCGCGFLVGFHQQPDKVGSNERNGKKATNHYRAINFLKKNVSE